MDLKQNPYINYFTYKYKTDADFREKQKLRMYELKECLNCKTLIMRCNLPKHKKTNKCKNFIL